MKKKFLLFSIFFASLFFMVGCNSTQEVKPDDTVKAFFEAAKKFDVEGIKTTFDANDAENIVNINDQLTDTSKFFTEYMKENASEISYEIENSEVTENEAVVTVKAKYVDSGDILGAVIAEAMPKLFSLALSGSEPTDEDMENIIVEILNEKASTLEKKYKEAVINISLIKKEDKWYITNVNDEIYDVLSSGIYSAGQSISEQFNLGL